MQMDEFTQRNAEMAQQTSSVASSMTAQAEALTDLISLLRIASGGPIAPVMPEVAGSDLEWQRF